MRTRLQYVVRFCAFSEGGLRLKSNETNKTLFIAYYFFNTHSVVVRMWRAHEYCQIAMCAGASHIGLFARCLKIRAYAKARARAEYGDAIAV